MRIVKRFVFVLLVSSLALTLAFVRYGGVPSVRASPSIFQGNLTLTNNNVTVIQGQFIINGSIIVEDNATLILRNAFVNFTQTSDGEFGMTFENPANGNPRLVVESAALISDYSFYVYFYGNSSCVADKLTVSPVLDTSIQLCVEDSSQMSLTDSTVYIILVYGGYVEASGSTLTYLQVLGSTASANVSSSSITYLDSFYSGSQCIVSNSSTLEIYTRYGSLVQLVNSTFITNFFTLDDTSRVAVSWYLGVKVVDSHGVAVDSANVTASYSNATVAESELTNVNGLTRLTLTEEMINATGTYPVGNYTVTAKYGVNSGQESVNMTGDQAITISLPFTVPEFPSVLVLPVFIAATLIAIVAFKRKTTFPAA